MLIVIIIINCIWEIYDVLKCWCFYYWVDYLDVEWELEIVWCKVLGVFECFVVEVVVFV